MNKEDIRLLFEYDRWANARVFLAASSLSAEQFTRDAGGSFPSLRDTLVHVMSWGWVWLEFWRAPSYGPALLSDLSSRREALFQPSAFPDAMAVQRKLTEIEKERLAFLKDLTDEALDRELLVVGYKIKLAHMMQHVVNHSTYHRGQTTMMMRQLGAQPLPTDFPEFLMAEF
jgi:uncharacterized damage-inducible protein DinB